MLIIKLPSQVLVIAAVVACLVTLGCSEAAAPPPASTLAPLPTYTPYPTHTPYPTPVEAATATPYPTVTARPTHTPYPTLAALPTYTPYPTPTAYPTHTPYQTPTPHPTETPTPTPLPTVTPTVAPTPTATPQPTVTPTPEPENWVYQKEVDELTGKEYHVLLADGESIPAGSQREIYLACIDSDHFFIGVTWGDEYIAENVRTDVINTQYKVDDGPLKTVESSEAISNDTSFFRKPKPFLADILKGSEVIIRVESYDGDTSTGRFPLKGLPEAIKQLPCI